MLMFENVAMFEVIYDSVKNVYPELKDTIIVVGFMEDNKGVMLLEGTEEDAGKYKIAMTPNDDVRLTVTFFISGLSMLVYKLRYGEYIQSINQCIDNENYKNILDTITESLEAVSYKGEYVYE